MSVRINNSQARRIAAAVKAYEGSPKVSVPWNIPRVIERTGSSSGSVGLTYAQFNGTATTYNNGTPCGSITLDPGVWVIGGLANFSAYAGTYSSMTAAFGYTATANSSLGVLTIAGSAAGRLSTNAYWCQLALPQFKFDNSTSSTSTTLWLFPLLLANYDNFSEIGTLTLSGNICAIKTS